MAFTKEIRLLSCFLFILVAIHKGNAFQGNEHFEELGTFDEEPQKAIVDFDTGVREPDVNCTRPGQMIADNGNCTVFYVCNEKNETIQFPCPDGLNFNPQINTCDPDYLCPFTPECENPGQVSPDPLNCADYYFCVTSGDPATHIPCPDGEFFSTVSHVCEPQANVDCNERPGCLYPGQSLPNYQDCSSFYICNGASDPVEVPCGDGLSWDTVTHSCVPSDDAHCATLPLHKYELDKVSLRSSNGMNPSVKKPAGTCTRPGEYLPDDADCAVFYVCQEPGKEPIDFECPNGTLYDPAVSSCHAGYDCPLQPICQSPAQVFPNKEDCGSFYFCETAGENPTKFPCSIDQFFNEVTHVCEPKEDVDCNGRPGCEFAGQSLPDAYDCTYYFVCYPNASAGEILEPIKFECPENTAWDTITHNCVAPENAICAATPTTIATTTPNSTPSGPTCTEVGQTFADPYDCGAYYQCDANMRPNHHFCDSGTLWDEVTGLCQDEDTVTCNTATNPTTETTTNGGSGTVCSEPGQVLYDEYDCAKFYTCDASLIRRAHQCNILEQLYYDPAYGNCNFNYRVTCSAGVRPQPTPTAFPIVETTTPAGTITCLQPGQFIQYSLDCKYFYKCSGDLKPELFSCPPNLLYHVSTGCCDTPEFAGCPGL